jgi:hypothetical protein
MDDYYFTKSGSFRTTVQFSLNFNQFEEFMRFINQNKIKSKTISSMWVPDGTPENEGYKENVSLKEIV